MKRELSPLEDRGDHPGGGHAPDGATLDYTNRYAGARAHRASPKEFDRIFANIGNPTVSQASVFFRTIDWDQRKPHHAGLARELQPKMAHCPGSRLPDHAAVAGAGLSRAAGQLRDPPPTATRTWQRRDAQFMDEMAKNPGIVSADIDLRLNKPELASRSTAKSAADLGVSVDVVARAIETMLGGRRSPATSATPTSTT
jgi:multidrug efflux pump